MNKIGTNNIIGYALGSSPVEKICQGATVIWDESESGVTPDSGYTPPADYTQIEYTQTNFRWFNTEIVPAPGIKVVLDFELTAFYGTYENNMIFGSWPYGYDNYKTLAFAANSGREQFSYYCAGGYEDYAGHYTVGNRYTVELSEYECVISEDGGIPQQYVIGGTNEESNKPILLGCVWPNPNDEPEPTNIKIYEGWIYSGNTLIAHYLPYTDENDEDVLYDNINDATLYYTDEIPADEVDLMINGVQAEALELVNIGNEKYYTSQYAQPQEGDEISFFVNGEQVEFMDMGGTWEMVRSITLGEGDHFAEFKFRMDGDWIFEYRWETGGE